MCTLLVEKENSDAGPIHTDGVDKRAPIYCSMNEIKDEDLGNFQSCVLKIK
jgi:hypothetical protein